MNRIIIFVLTFSGLISAQEIRRPTADADYPGTTACSVGGVYKTSTAMTNAYDAGTPPTTTSASITATADTTKSANSARIFTTWSMPSGGYTALSLNINSSCVDLMGGPYAQCSAEYSLDGGTTWDLLFSATAPTVQGTHTVTLQASQNLALLQVRVCAFGETDSLNPSSAQHKVWDIWTSGTLIGGAVIRKFQVVTR
jgi:hypothetical protein